MRKMLLILTIFLFSTGLYAERVSVAGIASYLEGVVDVNVELGQRVRKGDLLFRIKTDYTEIIREKCRNAVWYYTQEYERIKRLNAGHSKCQEDLDLAKYNLLKAKCSLEKEDLLIQKWSKYYAPFDGIVTNIYYYTGSAVPDASGDPENSNSVLEVTRLEDYKRMRTDVKKRREQEEKAFVAPMVTSLIKLNVRLGDKVTKGDVLFSMDMAYNEITKKEQLENIRYCRARYVRAKALFEKDSLSEASYQLASYDLKNAVQDLKATDFIMEKRSVYRAPFDGTVTRIIHYTGSNVFAGHKVLEIIKD